MKTLLISAKLPKTIWLLPSLLRVNHEFRMPCGLFVWLPANDTALSITQISFAMAVTQLMCGVSLLADAPVDRFSA